MNPVYENIDLIRSLCEQHNVAQLFVFGSVSTNKFTLKSDVDLLVDFKKIDLFEYADNYYSLKDELEKLLQKKVDLLEYKGLKNPYLKESIDKSKKMIYG